MAESVSGKSIMRPFMRRIVSGMGRRLGAGNKLPRRNGTEQPAIGLRHTKACNTCTKGVQVPGYRSCVMSRGVALCTPRSGGRNPGRVAADRVLPHSRRPAADGPYAVRVAAGADGVDRGAASGARETG